MTAIPHYVIASRWRINSPSIHQNRIVGPAWNLLSDISLAEANFLQAVNPELPHNFWKRVSWEESGSPVLIPGWTEAVAEHADQLRGITIGNLPKALGKVPEIALQMRDPKGMLWTQEQRVARARQLVGTAFALALVNNGWMLHSLPGEFYLERNSERLQPFALIVQLSDGIMWGEAWTEMCRKYGIESIELTPAEKTSVVTPPTS